MIRGNGVDIVKIDRIKKIIDKGKGFIERIYSDREKKYLEKRQYNIKTIAGLFAAKEAVSKVLGTGIRGFSFKDIEVIHDELGKPYIKLKGKAYEYALNKGIKNIHISISHDTDYAIAFALAEGIENKECFNKTTIDILNKGKISNIIPQRKKESHKGTYGRVAVIAGSIGMSGAAYLTSMAALKSGSGLVYSLVPKSISHILELKATEVIVKPLHDNNTGHLLKENFYKIDNFVENMDVIAVGPGLGVDNERIELIRNLLLTTDKPIVLDADGINCVSKDKNILKKRKGITVITPHPGELSRLLDKSIDDIQSDRINYAKYTSEEYGVITVLKGNNTIVTNPKGELYINPTGNPGMATAGSGDVLTGVITSFIGQGIESMDAAIAGVFIHGLAGDLASKIKGEYGITATDILENIPYSIKSIFEE
ncbi:NAD(P)H-hydrate dehydratase [Thermohalobacter berrensis]|uniref:Multifunctional fusion protein n=1 Tax=Thermohalobacter berrensis TaxID=99594 RepID=A0A419SXY5_9FIRM|nr:NAD(P)H-hydrate dehydratase [Thermohalobacter berrensis]RKD30068.1 carbohydrate kinase-like protein [Thermohalobacter berrensis]